MSIDVGLAVLFLVAFLLGTRATIRQWRRYRTITPTLVTPRAELIMWAFAVISTVITIAAGYYGFLSLRRVAGFDPLPPEWASISIGVAAGVLLLPEFIDRVVKRIMDG